MQINFLEIASTAKQDNNVIGRKKRDGVAIMDVGGESTRSGYTLISDEEESARVTPVIEALKKEFDVPVSLDTYK